MVIYTVSQKLCKTIFVRTLCQICTNFDNFWDKDGKEAKIMWDAVISTSSNSHQCWYEADTNTDIDIKMSAVCVDSRAAMTFIPQTNTVMLSVKSKPA